MKSAIPKHLQKFHAAIQAIPQLPGVTTDRDRFKLFVQCTLKAFQESTDIVFPLAPAVLSIDTQVFGFQRYFFPGDVSDALVKLLDHYMELVKNHPWEDVLGDYYQHLGVQSHRSQFFTPGGIAAGVAALVGPKCHGSEPTTLVEITCGSGSLLLAQIAHGRQIKTGNLQNLTICANDIDPLCAAMCALQLCSNQMVFDEWVGEVVITVGDALRYETQVIAFRSLHHSKWGDEEFREAKHRGVSAEFDVVMSLGERKAA